MLGRASCHGAQEGTGVGAQTARAHHDMVAALRLRDFGDQWAGVADTSMFVWSEARCSEQRTRWRKRFLAALAVVVINVSPATKVATSPDSWALPVRRRCASRACGSAQVLAQGDQVARGLCRAFGPSPASGGHYSLPGAGAAETDGSPPTGGACGASRPATCRARTSPPIRAVGRAVATCSGETAEQQPMGQTCTNVVCASTQPFIAGSLIAISPATQASGAAPTVIMAGARCSIKVRSKRLAKTAKGELRWPGPRSATPCCLWRRRPRRYTLSRLITKIHQQNRPDGRGQASSALAKPFGFFRRNQQLRCDPKQQEGADEVQPGPPRRLDRDDGQHDAHFDRSARLHATARACLRAAGNPRAASAITTALSPDSTMFTPMICSSAIQNSGLSNVTDLLVAQMRTALVRVSTRGECQRRQGDDQQHQRNGVPGKDKPTVRAYPIMASRQLHELTSDQGPRSIECQA